MAAIFMTVQHDVSLYVNVASLGCRFQRQRLSMASTPMCSGAIEMVKTAEPAAPLAVPLPVAPMIEVELAHGRVRLHGADATMLATVFNLLSAA
jgi:hypothetical protein